MVSETGFLGGGGALPRRYGDGRVDALAGGFLDSAVGGGVLAGVSYVDGGDCSGGGGRYSDGRVGALASGFSISRGDRSGGDRCYGARDSLGGGGTLAGGFNLDRGDRGGGSDEGRYDDRSYKEGSCYGFAWRGSVRLGVGGQAGEAMDQVRRARVGSEVAAHEVFDDMPCVCDTTARAGSAAFKAPTVSRAAVHELHVDGPLPGVIWDGEMPWYLDAHDGLLREIALSQEYMDHEKTTLPVKLGFDADLLEQLEQVVFKEQAVAQVMFDEMPLQDVVWDEEISNFDTPEALLQQLARGDPLLLELGVDSGDEELAEMAPQNDSAAQIEQVAFKASGVFKGVACDVVGETVSLVVWDEIPSDINAHDGLLQQLAWGKHAGDEETEPTIEPEIVEALAHINSSPLVLELRIDVTDQVTIGMPNLDIDKDTLVGLEQLYTTPPAEVAQQEDSKIYLSPFNKKVEVFGEFMEPVEGHDITRREFPWADMSVRENKFKLCGPKHLQQVYRLLSLCGPVSVEKIDFNLSAENLLELGLFAECYQLSGCMCSDFAIVLSQEMGCAQQVLDEMVTWGNIVFDHGKKVRGFASSEIDQILFWMCSGFIPTRLGLSEYSCIFAEIQAWRLNGFSPGASGLQPELKMRAARQWDPGLCEHQLHIYMVAVRIWDPGICRCVIMVIKIQTKARQAVIQCGFKVELLLFVVATKSNKKEMCSRGLADKTLGVLISDHFSADAYKGCSSPWSKMNQLALSEVLAWWYGGFSSEEYKEATDTPLTMLIMDGQMLLLFVARMYSIAVFHGLLAGPLSIHISTDGQSTTSYGGCALNYLSVGEFNSEGHAFAWGQANFCGGGSVTHGPYELGRTWATGHQPKPMAHKLEQQPYKAEDRASPGRWNRTNELKQFSLQLLLHEASLTSRRSRRRPRDCIR
ncbi:hypothetical protein ACP70R_048261 [Stipagrostis hirtigluma subsp. patula]